MAESEKNTERYLKKQVEAMGGTLVKMRPIEAGFTDRLGILPGPYYFFAETKSEDDDPRPLQKYTMKQLLKLGCVVVVLDTKQKVDQFLQAFKGRDFY